MQIFHCSPYRNAEGKPRADMKKEAAKALGTNWLEVFQTEDTVIDTLADFLDDDYILFANIQLLEDGPDADLLLFGPTGVWAVEFIHADGEFKAEGDNWLRFNADTNDYETVPNSPIITARDNAAAVYEYLHSKDLPVPWVNPVFVLTQQNITAYTENTAIATVRPGEVNKFAERDILGLDPVMDETDIQHVFTALKPFANAPSSTTDELAGGGRKKLLGMSTGQWVVILSLALLNVCVLGGFAWYVLTTQ